MNPINIGILILFLGHLLNTFVICVNGGYMPYNSEKAFKIASSEKPEDVRKIIEQTRVHTPMTEYTRLRFLSDDYGDNLQSIGDYLIVCGLNVWYILMIINILLYFLFLFFPVLKHGL